jgi:DNA-binding SARP family transcriptional activator
MEKLKIYLFGAPRLEYQNNTLEISRRKAVGLVAYLALASQPQSRDTLATLFWPDLDQERGRAALRSTLYSLTSLPPAEWVVVDRNSLELNREKVWIDASEFLSLLTQRRLHPHEPEKLCDACIDLLTQAAALYQDGFLAGFTLSDSVEYDDWQVFQREGLSREFSGVLRRLARHFGEDGRSSYDVALNYARRWLALDSLHEPAHRLLMQLYAISGQRTEALRQYQECVAILDAELATPPEEETVQLYEAIRGNVVQVVHNSGSAPATGILPSLPTLLVGREDALRDLKSRLGSNESGSIRPITVIQGLPGVGKSTLVSALAHDSEAAHAFPDGVLWASLGETPNLVTELLTWAKGLRIIDGTAPHDLEEISALLSAALRDKRMLLIVDDVWQIEHAAPFRVGGQNCALVLTSRLNDVAQALAPTSRDLYRLPVLREENALQLLAALAPDAVAEYPAESRELVQDLEGLPLAIQVAGRLLYNEMQYGWGVGDLLYDLRQGKNLLAAQAPGDMAGPGQDTTPTIAALLKRSTDALDDLTRQRFGDLGLFVPKPATFDLQAMAALWEIADPKPTARALVNRGLLEPLSGGRFQMHALLVLHARALLE